MKPQNHTTQLLRDLLGFVMANKKWWLIPMMLVTLLLVALVVLGSTPAAPFIYTVF
ncbi:MAG: DUF5989 family protein [Deltaproteobacteria bacterium]|nr:DUF5989 family protein [Deltaproteobacteria bacterium]